MGDQDEMRSDRGDRRRRDRRRGVVEIWGQHELDGRTTFDGSRDGITFRVGEQGAEPERAREGQGDEPVAVLLDQLDGDLRWHGPQMKNRVRLAGAIALRERRHEIREVDAFADARIRRRLGGAADLGEPQHVLAQKRRGRSRRAEIDAQPAQASQGSVGEGGQVLAFHQQVESLVEQRHHFAQLRMDSAQIQHARDDREVDPPIPHGIELVEGARRLDQSRLEATAAHLLGERAGDQRTGGEGGAGGQRGRGRAGRCHARDDHGSSRDGEEAERDGPPDRSSSEIGSEFGSGHVPPRVHGDGARDRMILTGGPEIRRGIPAPALWLTRPSGPGRSLRRIAGRHG